MNKQLAIYFFEQVSKVFNFVVREHNFAPPQIEMNEKINFTFVTFMGKNIAIECVLDEREADVDCKISRVINGKKVAHYAVDDKGVRVREGLHNLLRQRGVRERLFTKVGELELRAQIKITLADFAQMLKKYGQDILSDSPAAL